MTDCSEHTHLHAVHLRAAAATVAFAAVIAHPAVDVTFALLAALARPIPVVYLLLSLHFCGVVTGARSGTYVVGMSLNSNVTS